MTYRKQPNSVSATQLSGMVFCEANVLLKPIMTARDRDRINRGNVEHRKFKQTVNQIRHDPDLCKSIIFNDITVAIPPALKPSTTGRIWGIALIIAVLLIIALYIV